MQTFPKLIGIDHVHVYVSNRAAAAKWYQRVLGFSAVDSLKAWATEQGPLTLEDAAGNIHLALFQREQFTPSTAIAFGTDGEAFLDWKANLEGHGVLQRLADHKLAWSMYFNDPDKNMHEITTYDYAYVAEQVQQVN